VDFTQEYNRTSWLNFLENSFLPDDFRINNESLPYQKDFTKEVTKLGECPSLQLTVFEVKHSSVNDARVGLSKEAFTLVCDYTKFNRALALFVPQSSNEKYRFSYIEFTPEFDEAGKIKRKISNPRRYSYLLGKGCKKHTPKKYLIEKGEIKAQIRDTKHFTAVEDLIYRFSVEVLTKEFYDRLYDWYEWALAVVRFPEGSGRSVKLTDKDNEMHLIRLITRLIFVWFIKQKDLIPEWIFDKNELKETLKNFKPDSLDSGDYYNGILQNLFFATLNNEIKERAFTKDTKKYGNEQFGVKFFYRDRNGDTYFKKTTNEIQKMFSTIPFLNGGLFECLDKNHENPKKPGHDLQEYHDGFSREKKCCAFVPDILFFNDIEKGKQAGLISLFNLFNFTVEENTPVDVDVALDPELLGKVFENLLGYYNEETRTTARKESGSFYTPREIVDYMVTESLKSYLNEKISVNEKKSEIIDNIFSYSEDIPDISPTDRKSLIKLIDEYIIIDPACGSGAFPMGILNKLSLALSKLDKNGKLWRERQEERAQEEAKNAITIDNQYDRETKLKEISETFELNKTEYGHKLYLIENCLFGVDIKPIAIQITKLRFFISLVVEQKKDESKANYGIRPLPNLETKFVCANSLIGLSDKNKELLDLEDDKIQTMKKNLWNIREKHFYTQKLSDKKKLRKDDEKLRNEIKEYLVNNTFKPDIKLIAHNISQIADLEIQRKAVKNEKLVDISKDNTHLFDILNDGLPQYIDVNLKKRNNIDTELKRLREEIEKEKSKPNNKTIHIDIDRIADWDPYDQNAEAAQFFDPYWMFNIKDGFDIVIGNPPYVRADNPAIADQREIIKNSKQYITLWEKWDLMVPFIERGLKISKCGGFVSFIASDAITTSKYAERLQDWILAKHFVKSIDYFENIKVFEAGVTPVVLLLRSVIKGEQTQKIYRKDNFDNKKTTEINFDSSRNKIFRKVFRDAFTPVVAIDYLNTICYMSKGIVPNSDENSAKGDFVKDDLIASKKDKIHCKKYVEGKYIGAYRINKIKYLEYNTERVPSKLSRPTFEKLYSGEKILRGRITKGTFDNTGIICNDSIIVFKRFCDLHGINERSISVSISKNNFENKGSKTSAQVKKRRKELEKISEEYNLKYILAIINSKYAIAYLNNFRRHRMENYFYPDDFRKFPIPKVDMKTQNKFVSIVNRILEKTAENAKANISALERQIDNLVYRLYNLTYDEVKLIEPDFPLSKEEYEGIENG